MPRRRHALALTAMLATTSTTGVAQDTQGFVVRGMGSLSCQILVDALEGEQSNNAAARLVAWLSGYVSHANRATQDISDATPFSNVNELATIVARVCASNTAAQVEAVTASVLATLSPLAVTREEEAIELRRGEAVVLMRLSVLQAVQERLIERELLPAGSADEKRAKVGDALRGGISWRCSDAVNSQPRKGYATCQRISSLNCPIHQDLAPTHSPTFCAMERAS